MLEQLCPRILDYTHVQKVTVYRKKAHLRITCKYKWKKSLVVAAEANFLLVSAGYMVTFFIAYFTKLYIL